jgi:type VI secretion system protein ImpH
LARQDRTAPGAVKPAPAGGSGGANGSGGAPAAARAARRPSPADKPVDHASIEALWDRLNVEPWSHDFFALVRRIEALRHDAPGFGASFRASEDPLRFCQEPSLAFPPCNVAQFNFPRGASPMRLFVNFMGLLGPMGPMPLHLTEFIYQRILHHRDRTLARFLDVFHHRMIGLFYRAWAASQMPASFDRAAVVGDACNLTELERQRLINADRSRYSIYVGAPCGLGMDEVRHRDAVPDTAKLHFAGRLAAATKGPEGLGGILSTYLGVDAQVEEFAGRWVDLPSHDFCRLGSGAPSSSLGTLGGGGAVCGSRVWECQGAFRVRLGPMSYREYERLLPMALPEYQRDVWEPHRTPRAVSPPGATTANRLDAWIRNYIGDEFEWEAVLMLRAREVPRTQLGKGARLGWTTWIMSENSPEDRGDLAIRSRH